jgi:hypothetical protein
LGVWVGVHVCACGCGVGWGWRSVGRPRGLHGCSMDARYRDDGLAPLVDGLTGVVLARITASPVEYDQAIRSTGWTWAGQVR